MQHSRATGPGAECRSEALRSAQYQGEPAHDNRGDWSEARVLGQSSFLRPARRRSSCLGSPRTVAKSRREQEFAPLPPDLAGFCNANACIAQSGQQTDAGQAKRPAPTLTFSVLLTGLKGKSTLCEAQQLDMIGLAFLWGAALDRRIRVVTFSVCRICAWAISSPYQLKQGWALGTTGSTLALGAGRGGRCPQQEGCRGRVRLPRSRLRHAPGAT